MRNREEAAALVESLIGTGNTPGTCQAWTRKIYEAHAVGDVDGDGRADAVDGWLSEPEGARHEGDRNPPRGTPVAFAGGSRGDGHRAVSLGNGLVGSTDMYNGRYVSGRIGTATIAEIERSMGVRYLGWTDTISALTIPLPPVETKPVVKAETRGKQIDAAIRKVEKAKGKGERARLIKRARKILKKIKPFK